MIEYFPEKISRLKIVRPGESMDIPFEPHNSGTIALLSTTITNGDKTSTPINLKLELFPPSDDQPISTKTEVVHGEISLNYSPMTNELLSQQSWRARLTNLGKNAEHLSFEVSYPGDFQIKSIREPKSILDQLFNSTICDTKIRITSGENASFIVFPETMEAEDVFYTVPDFEHTIEKIWPIPDLQIQEFMNSVNSSEITYSVMNPTTQYPNGFFRFQVRFEEIGSEILGTYHCQLNDMQLTIDLALDLNKQQLSYNRKNVGINFSYDLNILGLDPKLRDYVYNPIAGYADSIKKIVENRLRVIFESEQMHNSFDKLINKTISSHLEQRPMMLSARFEDNHIIIQYFNT